MKSKRRDFLKHAGMAGLSAAGIGFLPACNSKDGEASNANEHSGQGAWHTDPQWKEAKYGAWKGPGVPDGPGPMDGVLLKDYAPKSSVVSRETFIPKAKFSVIDVHVHHYPESAEDMDPEEALAEWVRTQEETGVEKSVVLTVATGEKFDNLAQMYLGPYPDRFQLFCGIDVSDIGQPDYPQRAVAELERCYQMGARGVGEVTDKGFGLSRDSGLAPDERLHLDDPRLDPFWEKCAELDLPVNVHIADHPSSWEAPDVYQERTPIFQQFNQHGESGLKHGELLETLPRLLQKHPNTTFIACHLANLGHDLERLSKLLDTHSNLYLDISARDYEVGRQPRASARFLSRYSDRVLFGTDMGMDKGMYQSWWRLLESEDEHMTGRVWWRYYGLGLPDPTLEALYRGNALKILNWKDV